MHPGVVVLLLLPKWASNNVTAGIKSYSMLASFVDVSLLHSAGIAGNLRMGLK